MKFKSLLGGVFFLLVIITEAQAWNGTGHMVVAELAWRKLSSGERKSVSELLKQHPHYAELLNVERPRNADPDEWVFLRAATWPDMVRPGRPGGPAKPQSITMYHRADWHYINIPFVAAEDKATIHEADHPPKATNILERLPIIEATLRSKQATPSDRAVALCWYLHLLGDMHQPLHCSAWFSPEFPQGDLGGNSVAIQPQNSAVKLHAFWDDLLGTGESYTFIDHVADTIEANPLLEKSKLKELKAHKSYKTWGAESADFAEAFAYLDGHLRHAKWNEDIKAADVPDLNLSYASNAQTVAQRRVAAAGIRLGQKLKSIF